MNNKLKKQKGFSLIELLVYISSLIIVLMIVINSLLLMSNSYASLKITQKINQTATGILNRIVLDTRWSKGLGGTGSIFNVDAGSLSLNVLDDNGDSTEVTFYLDGTDLKMKEGLSDPVVLNLPDVKVDKFFLNFVDTGISKLVKIELELSAERKGKIKTETFYDSVVMRESY